MDKFTLKLKPYNMDALETPLFDDIFDFDFDNIEKTLFNKVYSDRTYDVYLNGELSDIRNVTLFINGFEVDSKFNNGKFYFKDNRIFIDNFGFVQISLLISFYNNIEITLNSDYFNVMIKENEESKCIRRMAEYVYSNQEKLLFDGTMKSLDTSSLKESEKKTIESQVAIIKEIISEYRQSFRYFKTNSKFTLKSNNTIDKFEKLNYVSSDTISYITQHPEELRETLGESGIKVGKRNFIPKNTLIINNKVSFDIYENQIVVGFLSSLINNVVTLRKEINMRVIDFSEEQITEDGYQASAFMIYGATKKKLENFSLELLKCVDELVALLKQYKHILPVSQFIVADVPKPTHTFLSIKQYNRIYKCIKKWYEFGIYDLKQDEFLLPFLANSQLYEYYVLLKLYNYFDGADYELSRKDRFTYKVPNSKYFKNTMYANTYCFQKGDVSITMYYQPVIFFKKSMASNQINIIRNTKLSMANHINQKEIEGKFYLPDYIIKFSKNGIDKYLILDSKYSNQNTVKNWYFPNLTFKYLFSLAPIFDNSEIIGLCAINGKISEDDKCVSVYTNEVPSEYMPFADILTISEEPIDDIEQVHNDLLSEYFEKYYKLL